MRFISKLLAVCGVVLSVAAQAANSDQAAAQLRKQLDAMNTLQGDFKQILFDKEGKKQDESSGTFMMQRPGKFYWKTEKPAPQILISNQKMIWLYDPDLQTVNERPFSDDLQKTPTLILSEDVDKLRKTFSINATINGKLEKYTLTPKVTDGMFQELILVFSDNSLTEFHIRDNLGQLTDFVLTNTQRNQAVNEALFNFVAPAGVDIIRN